MSSQNRQIIQRYGEKSGLGAESEARQETKRAISLDGPRAFPGSSFHPGYDTASEENMSSRIHGDEDGLSFDGVDLALLGVLGVVAIINVMVLLLLR